VLVDEIQYYEPKAPREAVISQSNWLDAILLRVWPQEQTPMLRGYAAELLLAGAKRKSPAVCSTPKTPARP